MGIIDFSMKLRIWVKLRVEKLVCRGGMFISRFLIWFCYYLRRVVGFFGFRRFFVLGVCIGVYRFVGGDFVWRMVFL